MDRSIASGRSRYRLSWFLIKVNDLRSQNFLCDPERGPQWVAACKISAFYSIFRICKQKSEFFLKLLPPKFIELTSPIEPKLLLILLFSLFLLSSYYLKFGDSDGPNLCRVKKVDVSSPFIENIYFGLGWPSSVLEIVSVTKIKNKPPIIYTMICTWDSLKGVFKNRKLNMSVLTGAHHGMISNYRTVSVIWNNP